MRLRARKRIRVNTNGGEGGGWENETHDIKETTTNGENKKFPDAYCVSFTAKIKENLISTDRSCRRWFFGSNDSLSIHLVWFASTRSSLSNLHRWKEREIERKRHTGVHLHLDLLIYFMCTLWLSFLHFSLSLAFLKWYGEVPPQVKMNLHWLIFLKWLKKNIHKQANSKRREYNRIIHLFWSDNQIPKVSKKFTENNLSK